MSWLCWASGLCWPACADLRRCLRCTSVCWCVTGCTICSSRGCRSLLGFYSLCCCLCCLLKRCCILVRLCLLSTSISIVVVKHLQQKRVREKLQCHSGKSV